MDISFSTSAGTGQNWSLEEMADWAVEHSFDCVRLATRGVADPDIVLPEGPEQINQALADRNLYLEPIRKTGNMVKLGLQCHV